MKHTVSIFFLLICSAAVFAQNNDCPIMERAAIAEARVWCAEITDGQACYGNSLLNAELLSDDLSFSFAGDKVDLNAVTTISSGIEENQYGVGLIRSQGYGLDDWSTSNVSLVLLGDVSIANTGNENINVPVVTAEIVGSQGANVRSGTSTDYRIITPLFEGEIVKLTGRTEDGTYYRLQLPSGETGWVAAAAIDSDVSSLPLVDLESPTPELLYPAFTSFSLETSFADAQCIGSWESGLLVQSEADSTIRVRLNGRELLLSGTIFVQSRSDVDDRIFVLEGSVQYADTVVEEGYWMLLTTDALDAIVEPYELNRLAYLPTEILPRYVYIGFELSTIVTPAPSENRSPIIDTLVTAPCVMTTGQTGANLRAGPSSEFPIRGVLAFRETVNPIGQIMSTEGTIWWELAQNIWVNSAVVVTGGDCFAVPQSQRIPILPPTATPEN